MMTALDYSLIARDLGLRAEADLPLAKLTTMRVGGPADWVFFPRTMAEAAGLAAELEGGDLPVRIIGGGSNIIVPDEGIRAAVIATTEMAAEPEELGGGRFLCSAGSAVPGLARWAARGGWMGLEFAEGIPARLGGAIRMNAGANRSSFSAIIDSVLLAGARGEVVEHPVEAGEFGYRDSFVARLDQFAVGAILRLERDDPEQVKRRMLTYRQRRQASQPLQERSAGCVFANWPDQPIGALVEALGLKGLRIGDAEVSTKHGNFIINRGHATAGDVLALIDHVREALTQATGLTPRLEVEIWSDRP